MVVPPVVPLSEQERLRILKPTVLDRQLALPTPQILQAVGQKLGQGLGQSLGQKLRQPAGQRSPAHREQWMKQQYGKVTTGVAIAVTAGVFAQVMHQTVEYEGEFQLDLKSIASTQPETKNAETTIVQADIAEPVSLSEVQLSILKSDKLLEPVVQHLQQQKINIDYATLNQKLDVTTTTTGTVQVRYRDANPQQVQAVLEQIAKRYQTYSQSCNEQACRDARWIHKQLPKLQEDVANLQVWLQQHRQRYDIATLTAQAKIYAERIKEIAQQEKDVNQKFTSAKQQYVTFAVRSHTQSNEALALDILEQDRHYRERLAELRGIEAKLTNAYGNTQITEAELKSLAGHYQLIVNQLNLEAEQVLTRYITNPLRRAEFAKQQKPASLKALQNAIDTMNYLQILQQRQRTLKDAKTQLQSYRQQIADAAKQQTKLEQHLQQKGSQLTQYTQKLATLEQSAPQLGFDVQLVAPPELIEAQTVRVNTLNQLKNNLATGTVISALIGMGIAAVMTKRKSIATHVPSIEPTSLGELQFAHAHQVNLPVDIALSKSRHLVDATIRQQII